jgi:hypothetical protein
LFFVPLLREPLISLRGSLCYLHRATPDRRAACGRHSLSVPLDRVAWRRNLLSSRPQPPPSWLACSLRLRCCASRRVRSLPPRRRAPGGCARRGPLALVRCAPPPARRIPRPDARALADLPWAAYPVRLQRRVRKWLCGHRRCCRRILPARLPTLAAPWARRTLRLAPRRIARGVALGGQAGVHLRHRWRLAVSRQTRLRRLRQLPVPPRAPPPVLGVDDGALRKRHPSGTILVTRARRPPVARRPGPAARATCNAQKSDRPIFPHVHCPPELNAHHSWDT